MNSNWLAVRVGHYAWTDIAGLPQAPVGNTSNSAKGPERLRVPLGASAIGPPPIAQCSGLRPGKTP